MTNAEAEADEIRTLERERLRAMVTGDAERAGELHAEDFQLVNPAGRTYTKAEYMGDIASGEIDYHIWEPETIAVRLNGDIAVVRYRAEMEITVGGREFPRRRLWHTDVYERREGQWQVVWSQATGIQET